MPDGVLEALEGAATERFTLLSLLEMMLLMDGRGADGIAEGNALCLGCAGMDVEGVFGKRWVYIMMENGTKRSRKQ